MRFDSIKSRLLLMTLICVAGMSLLVISQYYFTERLVHLNQQRDLLLRLGQDLLQMRRHEKDFLLRQQERYARLLTRRSEVFAEHLGELIPLMQQYQFDVGAASMLAQDIQYYQELFQRLVAQQKLLGLDTNGGLQGQLALSTSQLQRASEFAQNGDAYRLLTQAQLAEKNFSLTRDLYYAEQFHGHIEQLTRLMSDSQNIDLLAEYESLFEQLKDATVIMGLTHNQGLRGQFRDQAHQAESRLTALDAELQPILAQQEEKVKQYSIMIAVITSVALMLLLVKSFATFHRAFANFVMFFYRCKRQYQRIDPRQLGFSEFRSLAELANEMVDSRKEMEQRLSEVESKLKSQQG